MRYITAFLAFWYDFIIGDDWTVAATVVGALLVTKLLVQMGIAAWWLLPIAVLGFLSTSLLRVARR